MLQDWPTNFCQADKDGTDEGMNVKGGLDPDIVLYLQVYCSACLQIELDLFLALSYSPLPLSASGPTLIPALFGNDF